MVEVVATTIHPAETWERRTAMVAAVLPYGLLAISTALSLTEPGPAPFDRLVTMGLAAAAAAWVFVLCTAMDSRWRRQTAGRLVYVAGLLLITGVLVAHSSFFIAFAVNSFVAAIYLLPPLPALVGVGLASFIVFVVPAGLPIHSADQVFTDVLLVGLETLVVGGLGVMGFRARAAREQLVAELRQALTEKAGLEAQLLARAHGAGVRDERGRIAREIHDTLAQGLTGIVTQLEAAQQAGDRSPHVAEACALARESLAEARRSVQALRPAALERSRLPDAIADMARRWSETSSVALSLDVNGEPRPLLAELEVTLFRVAQEALTNAARHARASRVGLTLSYMDDLVLLDVRDDGAGFDPAPPDGRPDAGGGHEFGLQAMAQRLRQVGGELEIESAPGQGTAINARVPAIAVEAGA
jgi:signal transduction histidine kinase